jgi:RNA polymerase sigma-70 factor, ECF subfamily
VDDHTWLARRFEESRAHLAAVAFRMLGSTSEADDAVQEAWLKLSRAGADGVANLRGWLTTVVAHVCLDMLRARKSRREEGLDVAPAAAAADHAPARDSDEALLLADSVGPALLVVLAALTPAERVAFVLHDMFDLSFDEIAPILGRSAVATRQLASRARRRVQGGAAAAEADRARERAVVEAFLAASRTGDFEALLALLDPDVVVRADATAVRYGAAAEVRGANAVATRFKGQAQGARVALLNGAIGAAWVLRGRLRVMFGFTIEDGKIVEIELAGDPDRLRDADVELLDRD